MRKRLMMMILPKPKERPRAAMIGGHARIFTPKGTERYEKEIREAWVLHNGDVPEEGALKAEITFGIPIPKRVSKKRREEMVLGRDSPTRRPDLDNLVKAVMDALNGVAYRDDSQIVTVVGRKRYAEVAYVEVVLEDG